ncbi:MAG: tetratricopeptide repeat protein [Verrucomicrobiota bacterium]
MSTLTENDLPQDVKANWLKGVSAIEIKNYGYAIKLLSHLVAQHPGFLDGRRALRRAAVLKKQGEKKGFLGGGGGGGGLSLMRIKGQVKKDPVGAIAAIEKVLETEPHHPEANLVLYEAALADQQVEVATFALETIREGHPKATKHLHKLAQHYLEQNEAEQASKIYSEIATIDPTDLEAVKGAKDASARASMAKQNWETASFRDLQKDNTEAQEMEAASRTGMTREQKQERLDTLLQRYAADQNDLKVVKQVADLYEQLEQWSEAHQFYSWAMHLSDGDTSLERKISYAEEKVSEQQLISLEAEIAGAKDDATRDAKKAELETLKGERATKLIAGAEERVERNPTDPQLRFDLGQYLFAAGRESEAIPHLQRAKNNPSIKIKAMLLLGKCYEAKNMLDLAAKQLTEALGELQVMDSMKKDLLYILGLLYEKMDRKEDSLECLKQIYEADYGYRDVAERVESSYA